MTAQPSKHDPVHWQLLSGFCVSVSMLGQGLCCASGMQTCGGKSIDGFQHHPNTHIYSVSGLHLSVRPKEVLGAIHNCLQATRHHKGAKPECCRLAANSCQFGCLCLAVLGLCFGCPLAVFRLCSIGLEIPYILSCTLDTAALRFWVQCQPSWRPNVQVPGVGWRQHIAPHTPVWDTDCNTVGMPCWINLLRWLLLSFVCMILSKHWQQPHHTILFHCTRHSIQASIAGCDACSSLAYSCLLWGAHPARCLHSNCTHCACPGIFRRLLRSTAVVRARSMARSIWLCHWHPAQCLTGNVQTPALSRHVLVTWRQVRSMCRPPN
jgi:hypothetical protein